MKKFVIFIIVCISVMCGILCALTCCVDKGLRKTEYENFNEWNDIFDKKIHSGMLIQGSSRAKVQYSTFILDSALNTDSYNLGMDGAPFDVQYLRFKSCISNGIIPKYIIQNVDYETVCSNESTYQPDFFLPYISNADYKKQIESENLLPAYKTKVPFFKYAGELKTVLIGLTEYLNIHHFKTKKHKGYMSNNRQWNKANTLRREKTPFTIDEKVENYFMDYLSECKKLNIKVILVYSPHYYEFSNFIEKEKYINYYAAISEKYNIPFLNFSEDAISLDSSNYYNATHLNKTGAELFSTKLAHEIDSLGLME